VLYKSENDLNASNYAKFDNEKVKICFNYRQDINWNVLD